MHSVRRTLALAWVLVLVVAGAAHAADRYVDDSGSGTTCSSVAPCTFAVALGQSASSGDRILFRTGDYGTFTGTSKEVTLRADEGASVGMYFEIGTATAASRSTASPTSRAQRSSAAADTCSPKPART